MTNELTDNQWVCFRLAGELYAISTSYVQEIVPYTEPSPCPGSSAPVEGIVDIRGTITTIFSGHALINGRGQAAERTHILVLNTGQVQVGVSVDGIESIASFQSEQVQKLSARSGTGLEIGTVRQGARLVIILDFERYLGTRLNAE